jgi:hypothetical protein
MHTSPHTTRTTDHHHDARASARIARRLEAESQAAARMLGISIVLSGLIVVAVILGVWR